MARKGSQKAQDSGLEKTQQSGEKEKEMNSPADEKDTSNDVDPAVIQREAEKEKPWKMLAAVSFVVVMVFIGVPLWWKTTEVYRAPVPYAQIQELDGRIIYIPFRVELLWSDASLKADVEELKEKLLKFYETLHLIHPKIRVLVEFNCGEASENQKLTAKYLKNLPDVWPQEIENDLPINIIVVEQNSESFDSNINAFFDAGNTVFVRAGKDLESRIQQAISELYLNEQRISEIVKRNLKEKTRDIESKKTMWIGALVPKQSLDYYLINPDPESCKTKGIKLDQTVDSGLRPFYAQLENITELQVKSQILYYIDLPRKPVYNEKHGAFVLEHRHLPHLITPMEKYVTSLEPQHPVFNILLYITPPVYHPLMILDEEGGPAKHNSFSIAGWGGVTVVNLPEKCNASMPNLPHLPREVRKAIVSQLRSIFGIAQPPFPKAFAKSHNPLSQWEVQRQMIHATVENLMVSVTTLRSLTKLLDEIRNIVIKDEVSESIHRAVEALESSFKAINSRNFPASLAFSRVALVEAEKAFFDPSLLELLYFPDDQKYAIYIPLFLPVGAPVILSLRHLFKYAREKLRKSKTE